MKTKRILSFFFFLLLLYQTPAQTLERDYLYTGRWIGGNISWDKLSDELDGYWYLSRVLCLDCLLWVTDSTRRFPEELNLDAIPSLSDEDEDEDEVCCRWGRKPIYSGYLHFRYKGDFPFLKRQIEYTEKYPEYQAYWPETSSQAEKISNISVILFKDLVDSTVLSKVQEQTELSKVFVTDSWYFDTLECLLPHSLSACCFRFSDFYQVCKDLNLFSHAHFTEEECVLIEDKTDAILDRLCGMFLEMYEESLTLHPTEEIQNEIAFINLLYKPEIDQGKTSLTKNFARKSRVEILKKRKSLGTKESKSNPNGLPEWLISDFWLYEGVRCNDLFLHTEAITYLTAAIQKDPANVEAYQERIQAHFEMGNLNLAIEDYNNFKQLELQKKSNYFDQLDSVVKWGSDQGGYVVNPPVSKGGVDYAGGFCIGVSKGSTIAIIEIVPSTLSCCKGILHGLWSFACSPEEVSKDLINTSYKLVEFLKENTAQEYLEAVVPELRELCVNWDNLSDYERGNKTGYIIGKYGVDILAPGAVMKGIRKYRQLRRLNSMFTVECCVASEVKKAKILEASSKHAAIRKTVSDLAKTGKIIPGNANVIPHVMQEKHAWNSLLKLSGDKTKDFSKVVNLLEESNILSEKIFVEDLKNVPLRRIVCKKEISGQIVEAHFIEHLNTGEIFLNNAWIQR